MCSEEMGDDPRVSESWRRWRRMVYIYLGKDIERHPGPEEQARDGD